MSQICELCKKQKKKAGRWVKLRGKYNPSPKRFQKINLQWVTLATGKRVKACTKCIKALQKTK